MQIAMDYARTKACAGRLQDFVNENPREKLTRSSAIEAVARMLGWRNAHAMRAEMELEGAASPAAPDQAASQAPTADTLDPATAPRDSLAALLRGWTDRAREDLLARARAVAVPGMTWRGALHAETGGYLGQTALGDAETFVAEALNRNATACVLLRAAVETTDAATSEMRSAEEGRHGLSSQLAHVVVNSALGDWPEDLDDPILDELREDVDVSAWAPARMGLRHEGKDRVVLAQVLCMAQIDAIGADEAAVLAEAQAHLDSPSFNRRILNARKQSAGHALRGRIGDPRPPCRQSPRGRPHRRPHRRAKPMGRRSRPGVRSQGRPDRRLTSPFRDHPGRGQQAAPRFSCRKSRRQGCEHRSPCKKGEVQARLPPGRVSHCNAT
jgi:hypothetical protein